MKARLWRGRATDGSMQRPLLAAGIALGFCLVPHMLQLPAWISILAVSCATFRWQAERRRWRLPGGLLRGTLALATLLMILASFRGLNGVEPGSALLAVMAALKLLETHQRRDVYVVILVAAFLTLATLLRDQAVWVFGYLLIATIILIAAWIQVAREGSALSFNQTFETARRLLVPAIPLVIVFFIAFPRIPTSLWGLPGQGGGSAMTGISDTMTPGDISRLVQSDELVFRARFRDEPPPLANMYWRGPVLERFNGRTWSALGRSAIGTPAGANGAATIEYDLTIQPSSQPWLFGLDYVTAVARDGTDLNNAYELRSRRPLNNTEVIKMRSAPAGVIDQALRPVIRELLLQDNPQRNTRSKTLAREMRATLPSDRAFIRKVMDMFQNDGFVYTLEPPALGTNSVDEFLFDSRRGFCAHYASAFATLMRAADIPARVVLGYQGGELNPLIGQWQVRQSNAHAWNEVWLADAGWVRMDPTAAVSAARIAEGLDAALAETGERRSLFDWNMALAERIQLGWDALNARWDEWVLGYGPTTQKAFLSWLGLTKPSWRSITIVLVVATALILALVALLMRRSYRKRRSDPPETLYRGALQGLNIQAAPFATPGSVYELICNRYPHAANAAKKMVASYQALRYANQGSLDELRRTINDLQHVIRQEPATAATRPTQTTASK